MEHGHAANGWVRFLALWTVATAVGASLAPVIAQIVWLWIAGSAWTPADEIIFGGALGVLIGIGQWLVLRTRWPRSGLWVLASLTAGMLLGLAADRVGTLASTWFAFAGYGAILGSFQWPMLRRGLGYWVIWIPASAVAWGVASVSIVWTDRLASLAWWPFGELFTVATMYAILGAMAGTITGLALVWLSRSTNRAPHPAAHTATP